LPKTRHAITRTVFRVVIIRLGERLRTREMTDVYELFRWAQSRTDLRADRQETGISTCATSKTLATALLLSAERSTESGSVYFVAENRPYSFFRNSGTCCSLREVWKGAPRSNFLMGLPT